MPKLLYLLRHAKAEKLSGALADMDAADHDRPLTDAGITTALAMGRWFKQTGRQPEMVLCSTAKRTRETLDYMRREWPMSGQLQMERALYNGGANTQRINLLTRLQQVPDRVQSVMIVGHNPDLQLLAVNLLADHSTEKAQKLINKYEPGCLTILDLPDDSWSVLKFGVAEIRHVLHPSDAVLLKLV